MDMESANQIRDGWARAVGIPAFGVGIAHLTGLFGPLVPRQPIYWLGICWFIGLSAAVWHGNRWLLFKEREHLDWFDRPAWKVLVLLFAVVCFSAPLSVAALAGWYAAIGAPVDWKAVQTATLAIVICVFFVTHVYETVFLIKARESDLLRLARLERARAEAELEALKAQVDPHFLFNSLNTLAHLIEESPARALQFNEHLAQVYRYILRSGKQRLVPLADELEFVKSYFALLALRFGASLRLVVVGEGAGLLPPISLQILVENAIKHNAFSDGQPLSIVIALRPGEVEVCNDRRPREQARPSTRVGLKNLSDRFRLLSGREVEVDADERRFRVRLPTLGAA